MLQKRWNDFSAKWMVLSVIASICMQDFWGQQCLLYILTQECMTSSYLLPQRSFSHKVEDVAQYKNGKRLTNECTTTDLGRRFYTRTVLTLRRPPFYSYECFPERQIQFPLYRYVYGNEPVLKRHIEQTEWTSACHRNTDVNSQF